jgi:hypothetical protein
MQKHSQLYVISEPEAPAAAKVLPICANAVAPLPPREHSWRNLMRRLLLSRSGPTTRAIR